MPSSLFGFSFVFIFFCIRIASSTSIPIDNEVIGEPSIDCDVDSIVVGFQTRRPFSGRLFVKGRSTDSACSADLSLRSLASSDSRNASISTIRIRYGTCDVRRERSVNPRGVSMYSTVVVQFHSVFITEIDRSYRLSCFYKEAIQTVKSQLEVSVLSTVDLSGQFEMPSCTYTLRHNNSNGPLVRYARVGDPVVHRWDCQTPSLTDAENPYGMLVHSCIVQDARGSEVQVVDERGCSIDPYILGHLTYGVHLLTAYREAHVFKFADHNSLAFQCQIRLCLKNADACVGMTPPKCLPLKSKREATDGGSTQAPNLAIAKYVEARLVAHNWTMAKTGTADKVSTEKVVCFNGATDCLVCNYRMQAIMDEEHQQQQQQSERVTHEWHCKSAIANAHHRHHSLLLHSCHLSSTTGTDDELQLIDENGCELNKPELHDLVYDVENGTVMARGELPCNDLAPRSLSCQLRLCSSRSSDSECRVKLSKCKSRTQRSRQSRTFDDDSQDDVDVTTENLLVFDTDDLVGVEFEGLVSPTRLLGSPQQTTCLGYASAVTLIGTIVLLLISMSISCLFVYVRYRPSASPVDKRDCSSER